MPEEDEMATSPAAAVAPSFLLYKLDCNTPLGFTNGESCDCRFGLMILPVMMILLAMVRLEVTVSPPDEASNLKVQHRTGQDKSWQTSTEVSH